MYEISQRTYNKGRSEYNFFFFNDIYGFFNHVISNFLHIIMTVIFLFQLSSRVKSIPDL